MRIFYATPPRRASKRYAMSAQAARHRDAPRGSLGPTTPMNTLLLLLSLALALFLLAALWWPEDF